MAEKLSEYDFDNSRISDATYPYSKWFDGGIWKIKHGVDFKVPARNMRINLYAAAERRGLRVRTTLKNDEIVLQAYPWDDEE